MFKEGLKDLTITELADETGIERSRLYTYINTATPDDYTYTRGKSKNGGVAPYLLSERDIEVLSIIHELAQSYSIREVKEMLESETVEVIESEKETEEIIKPDNLIVAPQVITDFVDEYNEKNEPLIDVLLNPETEKEINLINYLYNNEEDTEEQLKRESMLLKVLVNGYDEMIETKHKVVFEDDDCGFFLYKTNDGSVAISNDLENYKQYKESLLLTEKEISNYDSRFMMFVHPQY